MNARANTRNVDLLRNVLVDEVVREHVRLWLEHEEPMVLNDLLRGRTPQHVIARRLQISMPKGRKLVGRVVEVAYFEVLASMPEVQQV